VLERSCALYVYFSQFALGLGSPLEVFSRMVSTGPETFWCRRPPRLKHHQLEGFHHQRRSKHLSSLETIKTMKKTLKHWEYDVAATISRKVKNGKRRAMRIPSCASVTPPLFPLLFILLLACMLCPGILRLTSALPDAAYGSLEALSGAGGPRVGAAVLAFDGSKAASYDAQVLICYLTLSSYLTLFSIFSPRSIWSVALQVSRSCWASRTSPFSTSRPH
jgi:hypothetical protein